MIFIAKPVRVKAHIITAVGPIERNGAMTMKLDTGAQFTADHRMIARYIPQEGDYWVQQEDGYIYLNPKDVFERKYAPHSDFGQALANCCKPTAAEEGKK